MQNLLANAGTSSSDGGYEPKYAVLAREIESRILSGEYRVGERLPSERDLAASQGVTPMTIRQALGLLVDKGLIERQQGRGTFVTHPGPSRRANAAAEATTAAPICVLGLSGHGGLKHPVNWEVRLMRFRGIVDAAFRLGATLQTEPGLDFEKSVRDLIDALKHFSGLILHDRLLPDPVLVGLHELAVPMVAINCYEDLACCSRIHVDSRGGTVLAVRHLLGLGHARIGLVSGDTAVSSMRGRLDGYRDALALHDVPVDDELIVIKPKGQVEDGADAARHLLGLSNPPTAIFAASDKRALGVLHAAAELGVSVPESLAVVGFDDIHEAEASSPPLSTVHNPLYETGAAAVQLLQGQIARGSVEPTVRIMPMGLVVRESCGAKEVTDEK